MIAKISQTPHPGRHLLHFKGDRAVFRLTVEPPQPGKAFVRTNIGHAGTMRREIIRHVEHNEPQLGRAWFDIPMHPNSEGHFEAPIDLAEIGHFEAKCFFLAHGESEPRWPAGENTAINVQPAETCGGNIIYNAFVRQFGPYKNLPYADKISSNPAVQALDKRGFTVIPPSGTFRDLISELDFIMHRLGCRILQLLPIHPTPTTYARLGRFGSPFASLSFTDVDAALAVFDPKATPLEQFLELVDAVHARHGKIIIDIAINHTGWAASLHGTHPQWLDRNPQGEIQTPGAWGVVWADLTRLDYSHKELWIYMADVFLTWCKRGVDGFRCDAGYMIPVPAWQYIIAKVRNQYPDTIFLLEGLGGQISVTRDLLNRGGFNWAYSELFQNYDRGQIEHYLPEAFDISASDGIAVHFAETHDNNRLAVTSATYARMRTALCALAAPFGAFGFANGVEWLATEKINVHEPCALNWDAADNQVDAIARLNSLLKIHPAFNHPVDLELVAAGEGNFTCLQRKRRDTGQWVLILANLNWKKTTIASWHRHKADFAKGRAMDLLTGYMFWTGDRGGLPSVKLEPGQVLCLADPEEPIPDISERPPSIPKGLIQQRLQAKALEIAHALGTAHQMDPVAAARKLAADPEAFCRSLKQSDEASRVIPWQYPADIRRHVMVPPGYSVLLRAEHHFRISLSNGKRMLAVENSLNDDRGNPFVLIPPLETPSEHRLYTLEMTHYAPEGTEKATARLLYLAPGENAYVQLKYSRDDCHHIPLLVLGTNGRGAVSRTHVDWQHLESRYDALLAANLDPSFPTDRHIMLSRCRAWVVYQAFSQDINLDCLAEFNFHYRHGGCWLYSIPTGQGEHIMLRIAVHMPDSPANTVHIAVQRLKSRTDEQELADEAPIAFILRPDIEDRNFHEITKAYTGPEHQWPQAVHLVDRGFSFVPAAERQLTMRVDRGGFSFQPEWYYMVHRPLEALRGLDPDSDLFSPGYFSCILKGGEDLIFTASVNERGAEKASPQAFPADVGEELPLEEAMAAALDHYVVRREEYSTVIAGYPWFLDWGRDTLIVARGLIAVGRLDTARAIIQQFASFEENGTIPNMIRGKDATNRDTSDGPLWLFTACADLWAAKDNDRFLQTDCSGRSLGKVLVDIAQSIIKGTPNGIHMDGESGLVYSPSHFTWMDTNHPACTPRQGYPVEIQALWYAALSFLARIDPSRSHQWTTLAEQVQDSIQQLFWQPELNYLADCRHGWPGQTAAEANADDALRPNQLLAVTLGAVTDKTTVRLILESCKTLLVPGAIRTLADRPVQMPLEIRQHGHLLNNPYEPYWGIYAGDEDTRRKPAYHNGTAWTWLFPIFCEAWLECYGPSERQTATAWLSSSIGLINGYCIGQAPEIVDGDSPHHQRGCDSQAWGVSELLRVWIKMNRSYK